MAGLFDKILGELADEATLQEEIKSEGDKSSVTREFLSSTYSMYGDALRAAAAVTGSEGLRRSANYQQRASELEKERSTLPQSYTEVEGVGDAAGYLVGLAAQSAPYLPTLAVGGGIGAAARAGLAKATGSAALQGGRATLAARGIGAAGATYPSEVGQKLREQTESGQEEDLLQASALAVPSAALNVVGAEGAVLGKVVGRAGAVKAGAKAGVKTALKVGSQEAAAELGQQLLSQINKGDLTSDEAIQSYKEALVAGGLLGGTVGGVRGAVAQRKFNNKIRRMFSDFQAEAEAMRRGERDTVVGQDAPVESTVEAPRQLTYEPKITDQSSLVTPREDMDAADAERSSRFRDVMDRRAAVDQVREMRKAPRQIEGPRATEVEQTEALDVTPEEEFQQSGIATGASPETYRIASSGALLADATRQMELKSTRALGKLKYVTDKLTKALNTPTLDYAKASQDVAKILAEARQDLTGQAIVPKTFDQRSQALSIIERRVDQFLETRAKMFGISTQPDTAPVAEVAPEPVAEPKAAPPETIALPPEPTAKPLTREQQQGMGKPSLRDMMSESERNTIRDLSDNISPAVLTVLDTAAENKFLSAPVRKAEIELKRPLTQEEKDYVEYAVILRQANEKREAAEAKDIERANKVQANLKEQDTTLGVPEKKPKPQPKAAQKEAPAAVVPAAPAAKPKAAAPADVSRRAEQAKATKTKKQTLAAQLREKEKAKKKAAQEAALAPKLEQTVANKAAKLDRIRKESADFARAREQVEADRKVNPPKKVETIPLPKGMVEGEKSRLPIAASEKQGPGKTANQKTKERRERRQRKAQMEGAPQNTPVARYRNRLEASGVDTSKMSDADIQSRIDKAGARKQKTEAPVEQDADAKYKAQTVKLIEKVPEAKRKGVTGQVERLHKQGKLEAARDVVNKVLPKKGGAKGSRTPLWSEYKKTVSPETVRIEQRVAEIMAAWKGAPKWRVFENKNIPAQMYADMQASGQIVEGRVAVDGVFWRNEAGEPEIVIFADQIQDFDHLDAVVIHETLAHYGLRRKFGTRVRDMLREMYKTNPRFRQLTRKYMMDQRRADAKAMADDKKLWGEARDQFITEQMKKSRHKLGEQAELDYSMEEAVAHASEAGVPMLKLMETVKAMVRNFGRAIGLVKTWSDNDIRYMIRRAMRSVIEDKGGSERRARKGTDYTYEVFGLDPMQKFIDEMDAEAEAMGIEKLPDMRFRTSGTSIGEGIPGAVGEAIRRRAEVHAKLGTDVAAKNLMATVQAFGKNQLLGSMFTRQLFDYIKRKNLLKGMDAYEAAVREKEVINRKWSEDAARIAEQAEALGNAKSAPVMDMLRTHTIKQTWAYQPKGLDESVDIDRKAQEAFNKLDNKQKQLYRSIIEHGISTKKEIVGELVKQIEGLRESKLALAKDDKAKERIREQAKSDMDRLRDEFKQLKGPYVPLARFGNYVLVGRSAEFKKLEQDIQKMEESTEITADTRTELNKLRSKREAMRADPNHYYMSMHETAGKAAEAQQLLAKDKELSNLTFEDAFEREGAFARGHGPRWADLESIKARVSQLTSGNPNDADATAQQSEIAQRINQVLTDLYLESLAEASARRHSLPRAGVEGSSTDVMRGFLRKAKSDAGFISTMKTNDKLVTSMNELRKSTSADATGVDGTRDDRKKAYNEILKRHYQSMEYVETPVQDKVMAVSSFWMLLSAPRYFIMNLSQAPLVSVPYMAGRYGLSNSYKAWWDAAGLVYKAMAKDWAATRSGQFNIKDMGVNPKEEAFLQTLQDQGLLDIGINSELGAWDVSSDNVISNSAKGAMQKLQNVARQVEVMNRAASGLAAFRMAEAAGKNGTAYGIEVVNRTHFDYTKNNAPSLYNKLPKVMTQFRKYQIGQIAMFGGLLREAFGQKPKDMSEVEWQKERAVAKKILMHTLANTALITGTMSLPAVSALLYLSDSIFGDDDEPFSTEEEIRKLLGDGPLAEYVLKGATAAVGVDLTGSIGYAQIASVMPFQDPDITSRDAFYKTVGALAGPWAGLAGSMADGLGYMQAGDMYKGVELMMPGLVKSSLKAYREQADGMTRRNGDVVLSADDVKALDTFWSALGFRSSTAERVGRLRGMLYKYEQGYKDAAARMKKEYVAALDAGDSRELARIRQDWVKMQQSKVRNGFKPSPIRDLLTAKKTQAKREKTYQDKLERLTPGGL